MLIRALQRPALASIGPLFWLAMILALAAALRLSALGFDYGHPDEVIAVKVPESLMERGSLDTNWKHADLPADFKLPQYNFSGYLLAMTGALVLKDWWPGDAGNSDLQWLRGLSALMGIACVFMTFALGRRMFGPLAGLLAALLVAVNPLLLQDSLYARPETFVTLLTLAFLWLLVTPQTPSPGQAFAAACVAGLLVATKVSMLFLLPLLLLAMEPFDAARPAAAWRDRLAEAWRHGRWLALGAGLGFLAGAPAAAANLADFFEGVFFLHRQYSSGHWPYGVHDGHAGERFLHAAGYFTATTGALFLLAAAGAVATAARRQHRHLAVFVIASFTAIQFAVYPAFFERNFSHVLPVFAIFAVHGAVVLAGAAARRTTLRAVLLAALLLTALAPSFKTSAALRWKALPDKKRAAIQHVQTWYGADPNVRIVKPGWSRSINDVRGTFGGWCGALLLEMPTPEDPHSLAVIRELQERDRFRQVAHIPSVFAGIPTSTLHTYFTPTTAFLFRPADADTCRRTGGGIVSRNMVGEPLPLLSLRADPGWTRGGAFRAASDPLVAADFYGSWSGSDGATGTLRLVASVEGSEFLVLPYVTGPHTRGLSTRIQDADSGKVLFESGSRPSREWQFAALRLPPKTRRVVVEARDGGTGWGEWFAFGMPRRLKDVRAAD